LRTASSSIDVYISKPIDSMAGLLASKHMARAAQLEVKSAAILNPAPRSENLQGGEPPARNFGKLRSGGISR
jgi:hypothetical protein